MSSVHTFLATVLLVSLAQGVPFSSLIKSPTPSPELRINSSNFSHLPDDIEPISYDINLAVDLDADEFSFEGRSVITFKPKKDIRRMTLHMKNLDIISGIILTYEDISRTIPQKQMIQLDDTVELPFVKLVKANSTCVFITTYKGKDNGGNKGFYRTSYKNRNGKQK